MSSEPKILLWDIEASALNATFGEILCIGYMWHGEKKPTILKWRPGEDDDVELVRRFVKVFETCDYHVEWYGDRFDLPMVRTRMIEAEMPPLAPKPPIDLWRPARGKFKAHSNRLNVWEEITGAPVRKTPIEPKVWRKALRGDKAALQYVYDHCENDVLVLDHVFSRMRPWLENEPARDLITGDRDGCPSCGSPHVTKKGFKIARTRKYQQWQCQDCGRWWKDSKAVYISRMSAVAA